MIFASLDEVVKARTRSSFFVFFTLLCERNGLGDVSHLQQECCVKICPQHLTATSDAFFFLLFLASAITEASI